MGNLFFDFFASGGPPEALRRPPEAPPEAREPCIWSVSRSVPNLGPPSGQFFGRSQIWDRHLVSFSVGPKFGTTIWSVFRSVPNLGPPSGQFFGRSLIWDHHTVDSSIGCSGFQIQNSGFSNPKIQNLKSKSGFENPKSKPQNPNLDSKIQNPGFGISKSRI